MCLDVIRIVSCLLGPRIAQRHRVRTRKKDSWTADTWIDRTMEESYDEDLTENPFLQVLRQEYASLFEQAVKDGLIICIPRCGSFAKSALVEDDFLGHILVPDDDEENTRTRFHTLAGREVKVSNRVLTIEYDIAKPCSAHLLFEETFYADKNTKYSLWCIERPLEQSISASRDNVLAVTNLREVLDLLWTEVLNKDILRDMTAAIEEFKGNHEDLEDEPLHIQRDLVGALYAKNLRMLLQDGRLREKTESNRHFLQTIKIAAETYTLHGMRGVLPRAVAAQTSHEDAALNKTIKNLHDLQLRDLGIRTEGYDGILRGKLELSRLNAHSTILGKTCCLRKALRYASEGMSLMSSDDILPVLIYLVIRAGMPNWIAELSFMKNFRYSVNSTNESDEAGFLITSLEAAVEHVRSGILNRQMNASVCNNLETNPKSSLSRRHEDITLSYLFSCIRAANQYEIEEILGGNRTRYASSDEVPKLCHPLCTCESCETNLAHASFSHLPTVNSRDDRGMTAIHVASLHGHANVVDYLLEQAADLNDADADGTTPLHCAASRGHQNTLLLLLHANADPRITDSRGNTPLHLAADHGHEGCVKALLYFTEQMGMAMNKSPLNANGETPLHHAAKWGYGNIVQILIEHGADTRVANRRGQTPLVMAHSTQVAKLLENTPNGIFNCKVSRVESARSSIRCNGDGSVCSIVETSEPNAKNNKSHKIDRLLAAIRENDLRLACYYLGLEGPLRKTLVNETPKLCHPLCNCEACATAPNDSEEHDNEEKIPSLALNARNSRHETALHAACEYGRTELVRILLDAGANVNSITIEARSPLHLACSRGYFNVVKLLLDCGNCEVNTSDVHGDTPLHLAVRNNCLKIVRMLIRYGANDNIRNSRGIVPLDEAEKRASNDIFAMQSFSSVIKALKDCRTINTCNKKIE